MEAAREHQSDRVTDGPRRISRAPALLRRHYLVLEERGATGLSRLIGDRRQHKIITYRVRELPVADEQSLARIERRQEGKWEELPRGLVQSSSGWQHVIALARKRLREEHPDAKRLSAEDDVRAPNS